MHKARQDLAWIRENTGMDLTIVTGPSGKKHELHLEGRAWSGSYDEKHFILFLRDLRKTLTAVFEAAKRLVAMEDATKRDPLKTKQ